MSENKYHFFYPLKKSVDPERYLWPCCSDDGTERETIDIIYIPNLNQPGTFDRYLRHTYQTPIRKHINDWFSSEILGVHYFIAYGIQDPKLLKAPLGKNKFDTFYSLITSNFPPPTRVKIGEKLKPHETLDSKLDQISKRNNS